MKKIYGTFGVEMRAYGQKLVKFCTHTHAAKLVVEIIIPLSFRNNNFSNLSVSLFERIISTASQLIMGVVSLWEFKATLR